MTIEINLGVIDEDLESSIPENILGEITSLKITGELDNKKSNTSVLKRIGHQLEVLDLSGASFLFHDVVYAAAHGRGVCYENGVSPVLYPGLFNDCEKLKTVLLPLEGDPGDNFNNCPNTTIQRVAPTPSRLDGQDPQRQLVFGDELFQCDPDVVEYTISPEMRYNRNAFSKCRKLKKITVLEGVKDISDLFQGCKALREVSLPEGLENISNAFWDTAIKEIHLPDSIRYMGGAFHDCRKLLSVNIPPKVKSLSYSFSGCSSLGSMTIPEGITDIAGAFRGTSFEGVAHVPSSVTSMDHAFSGCSGLVGSNVPDGITSLNGTFSGTGVSDITIPESVTSMIDAFKDCTGLISVNVPGKVVNMRGAFDGCPQIKDCIIPDTVTDISYAYRGTSIVSAVVPDSVTRIEYAFCGCQKLRKVVLGNGIKSIEGFINKSPKIRAITVPPGVELLKTLDISNSSLKEIKFLGSIVIEHFGLFDLPALEKVSARHITLRERESISSCPSLREIVCKDGIIRKGFRDTRDTILDMAHFKGCAPDLRIKISKKHKGTIVASKTVLDRVEYI